MLFPRFPIPLLERKRPAESGHKKNVEREYSSVRFEGRRPGQKPGEDPLGTRIGCLVPHIISVHELLLDPSHSKRAPPAVFFLPPVNHLLHVKATVSLIVLMRRSN